MSGHSKWHNIRERKGKMDAQKGATFTKVSKDIIMAVKQGGPDPEVNYSLKMAIQKAKGVNMPSDNIKRCIEKASGGGAKDMEEIWYEGYGPAGVAVMVKATTDNRNRTTAEVRHNFAKYGGNLGESGCVSFMFDKKGVISVPKGKLTEDDLMEIALEAGADDLKASEDGFEIYTDPTALHSVSKALQAKKIQFNSASITMLPKNVVNISEESAARSVLKLVEMLEELEDVQEVYANFDIPDALIEKVAAL
jgi:YebC/PmpR family DNA-binding regulatory protein